MAREVRMRVFLALPLSPDFDEEISPLLSRLERDFPQVRWVSSGNIHLTLHFFGSVSSEEIRNISAIMHTEASGFGPVEIFLEGMGGFPNLLRPRVIWVGVRGETERLQILQARFEKRFEGAGFRCEERSFKPHLTLGRVKEERPAVGLEAIKLPSTQSHKIEKLILCNSTLMPKGARYETLETYSLAAP